MTGEKSIRKASTPTPSSYAAQTKELGTTGLKYMSGIIDEEDVKELSWPYNIKTYRQMENDPLISGALFAIQQFIKSSEWRVEEYDGEGKPDDAGEQAEFLRQCIKDLNKPWKEFISDVLSMLVYGFSVHEIVYKKRLGPNNKDRRFKSKFSDGKYGWSKFPIRSQDTIEDWDIDKHGDLNRVRQRDFWNDVDVWINEDRFLLFRPTAYKDNPQGRSILRNCYRAYYNRRNVEIQEGIGIERDLSGLPLIRVPSEYMSDDASEEQQMMVQSLHTMGQNLKRNSQGYAMLPSDIYGNEDTGTGDKMFDLSLLNSGGSRQVDTNSIIDRYDHRIMQSMLTDFMLLGGSVGSYALSANKVMAFVTAIESYLDVIADQFNEKAIPLLWEVNGWDSTKTPRLAHSGVENTDLETLGKFLKDAAASGMITPDDETEEDIRQKAKLPKKPEEAQEELSLSRMRQEREEEARASQAEADAESSNSSSSSDGGE